MDSATRGRLSDLAKGVAEHGQSDRQQRNAGGTVLLLFVLVLAGCAVKKPPAVWVFANCAHNGDHEVCECSKSTQKIDAQTGRVTNYCQ